MRNIKDCYNKPPYEVMKEHIPYAIVNDSEFTWVTVNEKILIYRKYLNSMDYYLKGKHTSYQQITRIKP